MGPRMPSFEVIILPDEDKRAGNVVAPLEGPADEDDITAAPPTDSPEKTRTNATWTDTLTPLVDMIGCLCCYVCNRICCKKFAPNAVANRRDSDVADGMMELPYDVDLMGKHRNQSREPILE